jgi:hypothetical protein
MPTSLHTDGILAGGAFRPCLIGSRLLHPQKKTAMSKILFGAVFFAGAWCSHIFING